MQGARAGEDRHLAPGVQHVGGGAQVGVAGHDPLARHADARVHGAVLARRLLHRLQLLQVVGHDDAGDRALVAGDAHGAIDQVPHLGRHEGGLHELVGDVLEQALQIHLLLVVAAHRRARLLADDGHHRRVVRLGVVQAVEQVDRARAGGRHAHAHLPGELGMCTGHERRQFLMARLQELHALADALERTHQAVDAVARVAEHPAHAPGMQPLEDLVAHHLGHRSLLACERTRGSANGVPRSRKSLRVPELSQSDMFSLPRWPAPPPR